MHYSVKHFMMPIPDENLGTEICPWWIFNIDNILAWTPVWECRAIFKTRQEAIEAATSHGIVHVLVSSGARPEDYEIVEENP